MQNAGRGPDIPGHPGALHLHHVLHGRTEPGAGALLPGHADHHSGQQRRHLLRSVDVSISLLSINKTLFRLEDFTILGDIKKLLGVFLAIFDPLPPLTVSLGGIFHVLSSSPFN